MNLPNRQAIIQFARSTTARLAFSYLAIIMVLSIGFSFTLYAVSAHELGRQEPPITVLGDYDHFKPAPQYHSFFEHRIEEGRHILIIRLVLLNGLVLLGGAGFSYYMSRRTLEPIEQAIEAQTQFVTDASHELRTPLTVMLASNEVALRDPKLTLAKARDIIASNVEEATKLRQLTKGLLSLAAVGRVQLVHEPVSLQAIVGDAINRIVTVAQTKKITVDDQVPDIKVDGNRTGIVQAVTVLLDNAIKYSTTKSTIYLTGRTANNYGYLEVRDEGIGIDKKDMPRIFDRFYRADESRTHGEASGYGIGLSIAKKIIEQNGGTISVASQPSTGTTFTVAIPLHRS